MATLQEKKLQYLKVGFLDIFGKLHSLEIPGSQINSLEKNGMYIDGSQIEGFQNEESLWLKPDLESFYTMSWDSRTGFLFCDLYLPDKETPHPNCSRSLLKRQLSLGEDFQPSFSYEVGISLEFYLQPSEEQTLSYEDGEKFRRTLCAALDSAGFVIEKHEVCANSHQHKISYEYSKALCAADNYLFLKYVIQTLAKRSDYSVTFMPKPYSQFSGSGLHINQSIFHKNGGNLFMSDDPDTPFSILAEKFLMGQMKYVSSYTAITNPTVNSYKRLVPNTKAPTHVTWGWNRSTLFRVPPTQKRGVHLELRSPDATCNIYQVLSVLWASGLYGIGLEEKIPLANPLTQDLGKIPYAEKMVLELEELPTSLYDALSYMDSEPFVKEVLGEDLYYAFLDRKLKEWTEYSREVHQWERDRYL